MLTKEKAVEIQQTLHLLDADLECVKNAEDPERALKRVRATFECLESQVRGEMDHAS